MENVWEDSIMIVSTSCTNPYVTEVTNGQHVIYADTSKELGGSSCGFDAQELFCASFASCVNITTRMILEKKNLAYDKIIVKVELKEQGYKEYHMLYSIEIIADMPVEMKQNILNIVRNCPISKILEGELVLEQVSIHTKKESN